MNTVNDLQIDLYKTYENNDCWFFFLSHKLLFLVKYFFLLFEKIRKMTGSGVSRCAWVAAAYQTSSLPLHCAMSVDSCSPTPPAAIPATIACKYCNARLSSQVGRMLYIVTAWNASYIKSSCPRPGGGYRN